MKNLVNKFKNNDLIITENKKELLKYLNDNKIMLNLRIMNLNEFKNLYFGTYDKKSIYYLIDKYNYKFDVAKLYLNNYLFLPSLKKELEENKLIINTPLFKESISRIINIGCNIDSYIEKELNKYEYLKLEIKDKTYRHPVYEFNDIESEINFVAISIIELLKEKNINDIILVNISEEYEIPIKYCPNVERLITKTSKKVDSQSSAAMPDMLSYAHAIIKT